MLDKINEYATWVIYSPLVNQDIGPPPHCPSL